MGLIDDLGGGPVALDTAVFIYFIEENPRFLPVVDPVFSAIDGDALLAVTSALTLLEILVVPYRAGDFALADRYEDALTRSRIRLVEIDRAQLRGAAQLRSAHRRIRTPDALADQRRPVRAVLGVRDERQGPPDDSRAQHPTDPGLRRLNRIRIRASPRRRSRASP